MKNKYVMIGGFAFSEESDMNKLKKYAKEGWILESIVAGFFYRLKKDKLQNIDYSLDYQSEATEEYFNLFKEAGWTLIVSVCNEMHIFSAQEGTKPIYSDRESEIDKYARVKKQTGKGAIYSFIPMIIFDLLGKSSSTTLKPIFIVANVLFIASMIPFIFNFMPYLAYSYRLRKMKKRGI